MRIIPSAVFSQQPLIRRLVFRSLCIFLIFLGTLFYGYSSYHSGSKINWADAQTINRSGMQRMLSQRILLLIYEFKAERDLPSRGRHVEELEKAFGMMAANHKYLEKKSETDFAQYGFMKPHDIYFGAHNLSKRTKRYLTVTEAVLRLLKEGQLQVSSLNSLFEELRAIQGAGFLRDLDKVTFAFQEGSERKTSSSLRFQLYNFLFSLFLILLAGAIIFLPMISEIRERTEDLEERNGELLEFTYRTSHDLIAPIKSARTLMDLIALSVEEGNHKDALKGLEKSKTSLGRLLEFVQNIVNLTKSRNLDGDIQEFSPAEVVNDIIKDLSNLDSFGELKFENKIDSKIQISGNKMFLMQSLGNLLSNAIKYQDPNKSDSVAKIDFAIEGDKGIFSVWDNGLGIEPKYHNQIFKMFARFHTSNAVGSGLGLYLVKQNMEKIKGNVVYIPHSEGSEFKLIFPPG